MRESVRNKRKLIVTAVAVIIAMLLSVTTGLLLYNPKGNLSEGITDGLLGNVADSVNLSNTTTGKTNPDGLSGTPVSTQDQLKSLISSNGNGYLVNDVDLDWGNGKPNGNAYTGNFNGNGKSLVYGETDGFIEVIRDKKTDDLLGMAQAITILEQDLSVLIKEQLKM